MVNFPDEEFQTILNRIPTVKKSVSRPKAYSILINGELFVTDAGKTVWKQRNIEVKGTENAIRPVNINTIQFLVFDGVKYIVE